MAGKVRRRLTSSWSRLAGAMIGAATSLAALSLPSHATDTVRFGLQTGAVGSLRLSLAEVEKQFDLNFDVKNFADSTACLMALDQGQLEVANSTPQHLIRAIDEGMDVVWVIGGGGGYNVVVARKDIDVKPGDWGSLKALAESRKKSGAPLVIGVPTGSMQHAALLYELKAAGIDSDKGVEIANIPFPTHPRALEGRRVDLVMTHPVFAGLAISQGDGVLFARSTETPAGKQGVGYLVRRELIENNRALVQRIVDAEYAAMQRYVGKVDAQLALEKEFTQLPDDVVKLVFPKLINYDYRINVADIKGMARQLYELGWVKKDYSGEIEKHIDFSFLEKASGKTREELSRW